MAGRIQNRRELRAQAAAAVAEPTAGAAAVPAGKPAKAKAARAPRAKKARAKKAPPRMRARWGVFDAGMKQVAIFDYNQRAAADEKCADLVSKRKGPYFLQIVKEPITEPEPEPAAGAG